MNKTFTFLYSLALLVIFGLESVQGQTITQNGNRVECILPSTEGVALIKSIERQPSLAFGIPNISIPVFSVPSSSLNIELSYNASGIQVDELPTSVGTGWRLEVGNRITRTVLGLPDDYPDGYINRSATVENFASKLLSQYTQTDFNYLVNSINPNIYDDSPDIFYYDILGVKGKFILGRNGEVYCYPRNNFKITYELTTDKKIKAFKVKFANGSQATFDVTEGATTNILNITSFFSSSWLLSKIADDNKTMVSFIYDCNTSESSSSFIYRETRNSFDAAQYNALGVLTSSSYSFTVDFHMPVLKAISSATAVTSFEYDETGMNNVSVLTGFWLRLSQIRVKFANNGWMDYDTPVELCYNLIYDQVLGSTTIKDQYYLRGFNLTNKNNEVSIPYSMDYYSGTLPRIGSKGRDLWGYPNGASNVNIVPAFYMYNGELTCLPAESSSFKNGANRLANLNSMNAGMLKSITNPDGLTMVYTYGLNKFLFNGVEISGNGLRVEKIEEIADDSTFSTNYSYTKESANTTSGALMYHSIPIIPIIMDADPSAFVGVLVKSSYHGNSLVPYASQSFYKRVVSERNGIKSVSSFEIPVERINTSIIPSSMSWCTSANNANNMISGYNIWNNSNEADYRTLSLFNIWNTPLLVGSIDYDFDGKKVRETKNTYGKLELEFVKPTLKLFPVYTYNHKVGNVTVLEKMFNSQKIYFLSAWRDLLKIEKFIFNNNNEKLSSETSNYEFTRPLADSYNYSFIRRLVSYNVPNEKTISRFKYCFDNDYITVRDELLKSYKVVLQGCLDSTIYGYPRLDSIQKGRRDSCYDNYNNSVSNYLAPELAAINLMKERGNYSTPLEDLTIVQRVNSKKVIDFKYKTYEKHKNGQIYPKITYDLRYPIDSATFFCPKVFINSSNKYAIDLDTSQYSISKRVTRFGDRGEELEYVGEDKLYHAKIMSSTGDNPKLSCDNCRYDQIKNYYQLSEAEEVQIRKANPKAFITTRKYLEPVGAVWEVDPRGYKTYRIFNTLGQLVATRDNKKNLRSITATRKKNQVGTPSILIQTDPLGDASLLDANASTNATISTPYLSSGDFYDVSVPLPISLSYSNSYTWKVNFGDDNITYNALPLINHKYKQPGTYNIRMDGYWNNKLISSNINKNVTVGKKTSFAYSVEFVYSKNELWYRSTTCPSNANEIEIVVNATGGYGEYTTTWTGTFTPSGSSSPQSLPLVQRNFSNSGSGDEACYGSPGKYSITLCIKDSSTANCSSITWNFTLVQSAPHP